jgi:hypothetical protein
MTDRYYLLSEVAHLLHKRPYQVSYVLSAGIVPDVDLRLGGRRLFKFEDVQRLARHFGIPEHRVVQEVEGGQVAAVGHGQAGELPG